MSKKRYGNELHPLYSRWLSMKQRCENKKHSNYSRYGGRGILISECFKLFGDYKEYVSGLDGYDPANKSIDRIDNNLGYQKGNLRWVTQGVQVANQSTSGKGNNMLIGVNWNKCKNRWIARVWLDGKSLFTKDCLSEDEALQARNKFIIENDLPHTIQFN